MDYKKKYEEALDKARIYHDNAKAINDPSAERYENIFPELAESEDERIRKFLIDYFHVIGSTCSDGMWKGFSLKDIYSWLERQTEEKHPDGCFTCGDYKKGYEAGRSNGFTAGYNKARKEMKPVTDDLDQEVHRFFEECITVHDAKIYGVEERVIPVDCYEVTARHFARWQKKQDSAEWSEDDELHRNSIISTIEMCMKDCESANAILNHYKSDITWFKNLCPQQKIEWSDEEKGILLECISALQNSSHWLLADKLSSLRPKPKQEWSEDEEQMFGNILNHYSLIEAPTDGNGISKERYLAFIKSLRPQPKQEWSEIDSLMLDSILSIIEEWESNQSEKEKEYYGATPKADWLKSLRPQPRQEWSEEDEKKEIPMPDSTKLLKMWEDVEKMLKEKSENDPNWETWRIAYNAFLSGFGKGIMVKQQSI